MSSLINRNVVVAGHRTSMRLEPEMWDALADVCRREKCTIRDICTLVDTQRGASSLTSAVRVFVLAYFRSVARNLAAEGNGVMARSALDEAGEAVASIKNNATEAA